MIEWLFWFMVVMILSALMAITDSPITVLLLIVWFAALLRFLKVTTDCARK